MTAHCAPLKRYFGAQHLPQGLGCLRTHVDIGQSHHWLCRPNKPSVTTHLGAPSASLQSAQSALHASAAELQRSARPACHCRPIKCRELQLCHVYSYIVALARLFASALAAALPVSAISSCCRLTSAETLHTNANATHSAASPTCTDSSVSAVSAGMVPGSASHCLLHTTSPRLSCVSPHTLDLTAARTRIPAAPCSRLQKITPCPSQPLGCALPQLR